MTMLVDVPDTNSTGDFAECYAAFRPFPASRMLAWSIEKIVNDQGRPYDHYAYPHLGAPGGPMDAFDDPAVRTISEQFATRLGKTFFGLCALLYFGDKDPCPALLASESQDALKRVMGRMYAMIYQRKDLKDKLLIRARKDHKQDHIKFRESEIRGAWARSPGSLADMNIKVGLANEVDKEGWTGKTTTKEGAPIKLFDDRFKDYQSVRKVIYECTPTVQGSSRIERLRLAGSNCFYYVPCPHCLRYQTLRMSGKDLAGHYDSEQPGKVEWDQTESGKSDRDLARQTARYVCRHCESNIDNESRAWMMRRGVWVPDGCGVLDDEAMRVAETWSSDAMDGIGSGCPPRWKGWANATWITGRPARNGPDASYFLSSLYALALGWGDIAAEFVACKGRPQFLRNFVNQWLGETWALVERKQTWEQLGIRLIREELYRQVVPYYASLVTVGVDRQKDHFVYVVDAWGPDRTHTTIEYGEVETLAEIIAAVSVKWYKHEDEGSPVKPTITMVDSGFRPKDVYEDCQKALKDGVYVIPCKGSSRAMESDYRLAKLGPDTSMPGMPLVHVDTVRTQAWIDDVLNTLSQDDAGSAAVYGSTLEEHQDFLEQLLNDAASISLDTTNNEKEVWGRVNSNVPNDFRDCRRYSYAGMLVATRGRPIPPRTQSEPEKKSRVVSSGVSRRDGSSWMK